MKLWEPVRSLFSTAVRPPPPDDAEQPLLRSGLAPSEAGTSIEDGSAPEGYRDAAALLLIKLGRSPNERFHVSPKDDSRVLRRIDGALLPLMLSVYFLQALDKATLSYASIFGLIEDTNLVGNEFSWLGSIVFLAQLVMQLPIALALVKLPIGKFTSAMVLGWGLTLTATTWASTFPQLMAARFFLGAFEASVGPSFVAITQMWWRRREQTMRIGSWYCMNGLTWVFGSLATYGLASITSSLRPYQIIFLTFGLVTVAVAVAMFILMPDSPTEAKFLNDNDKLIAIERLRGNQMGIMSREWRQAHFFEALQDVKTWLWVAMIFCVSVPSNGISTFGPLIIHSFVSDPFDTMLFNVPVGMSHVIAVSVSAYVSMKWKVKGLIIILLCIPPIIGFGIMLSFPHDDAHRAILLAGYFCLSTFTGITPLIYTWSAQNTAGDTKRKSTSALVFIGSSAGNIVGPLLFTPEEAPFYSRGLTTNIALFSAIILLVFLTSAYLKLLNKRHAERRVALGKKAVVFDSSLETAGEVARMSTIQENWERDARLHNGELGSSLDHPEGQQSDYEEEAPDSNAFADLTDLENEDFIFVF